MYKYMCLLQHLSENSSPDCKLHVYTYMHIHINRYVYVCEYMYKYMSLLQHLSENSSPDCKLHIYKHMDIHIWIRICMSIYV